MGIHCLVNLVVMKKPMIVVSQKMVVLNIVNYATVMVPMFYDVVFKSSAYTHCIPHFRSSTGDVAGMSPSDWCLRVQQHKSATLEGSGLVI